MWSNDRGTSVRVHVSRVAHLALLTLVSATTVDAQSFGRNKVQYDRFDFRALATEHFDVYYYPAESLMTVDGARMAERWYARHSALLQFESGRNPLIFYADAPDFQQTNVISGRIGQGTGGVTEGERERVVMPFTGSHAETDHVLGHELVHVFQYRMAKQARGGLRSLEGIPLWLIEGMAEYLSLGREDPNTAMWLRDALRRDDLPTLKDLTNNPKYFPYRYGQALWAYIGGTWGDGMVNRLYRAALDEGWEGGVRKALGITPDSLSKQWHAAIRDQYTPTFVGRSAPDSTGRAVIRADSDGDQNLAPTLSPDGRFIAFFSSRDLFGIDLYLAETATGRIVRRLTKVTARSHYDDLSFIRSAGSFSPDGRQIAVVTFANGDQDITIFRVSDGGVQRRIQVADITAMSDPAWSPDGRSIAFAGFRGGISDLYVYALEGGSAKQITNGREAELQPAWSPDGRTIAFITDRGPRTDFTDLTFGAMGLATIAADGSGGVQMIPTFATGKSINPQYSPDGKSLYFVSDQDGISDVYRRDDDGAIHRLTQVATGISGISALSPALSVARQSGAIVASVFDKAGFAIRAIDGASTPVIVAAKSERDALTSGVTNGVTNLVSSPLTNPVSNVGNVSAESASARQSPRSVAGVLPPALPVASQGGAAEVARQLEDARTGLIEESVLRPTPVDGRLRLSYVSGANVGVSVGGGYGNTVAGGIGFGFTDMLGNQEVGLVVRAQGEIQNTGASLFYMNRKRRFNWGAAAAHMPYVAVFATAEGTDIDGVPGTLVIQQLQRVSFDNADLIGQYALSPTRRVEFSGGVQRIGFSTQTDSQFIIGNQLVGRTRDNGPSTPGISLGRVSAAMVGDNSFTAFTSPVAGGRYRFELSSNAGDVNFQTALVDYRRYFFRSPLTFAVRGIHFGRYGADAESELIGPLFVGQPALIRGYEAGTFSADECEAAAGAADGCPQFTRLSGSKIAVVNFELRIPLFGNDRFGLFSVPWLPIELSPFVDAGLAWTADESPRLQFDRETADRVPVVSTGLSTRLNLFGYAVLELYWAYPFHRPVKGGFFGFQLAPGW